ncbi:MAG: hypothetical protein NTW86_22015 [Candidatus Sumerlaeota bacterium]|nr:hypothetical protein [Candidatus Sumerlaeota bacterium]
MKTRTIVLAALLAVVAVAGAIFAVPKYRALRGTPWGILTNKPAPETTPPPFSHEPRLADGSFNPCCAAKQSLADSPAALVGKSEWRER